MVHTAGANNSFIFTVKKTGEGYYLASPTGQPEELGRNECIIIKKEIMPVLKPHREITINMKGIKSINTRGFHILQELKQMADASRCKLRYINAEASLAGKLAELTKKKIQENTI